MSNHQRKLSNYLKVASLSRGYYLYVLMGGIAFLSVLAVYASKLLNELGAYFETIPDPGIAAALQERLTMVAIILFTSFICFLITTVLYMILLGQRVGGASVAIVQFIQALKAGNYEAARDLRKGDELTQIMTELKDLARILKARENRMGPT